MAIEVEYFKDNYLQPATDTAVAVCDMGITDTFIQSYLNIAKAIITDMLGFTQEEAIPEVDRVTESIYLLALFYIQNRSTQERKYTLNLSPGEGPTGEQTRYYRANIFKPLLRQITGMISPYRKHSKFIPEVTNA